MRSTASPDRCIPGRSTANRSASRPLWAAALQARILQSPTPPVVRGRAVDWNGVSGRFGRTGVEQFGRKALTPDWAERLNRRLADRWDEIRARVSSIARPLNQLEQALQLAGAPRTPDDLGLDEEIFFLAACSAREMRDRYTILDLAADSGRLDSL